MEKEIIRAERLSKYYGDGEALVKSVDQVELSIEKGGITAIVGRSGSGKTTLLHVLGGLEPPTEGRVLVDGHSLYNMREAETPSIRISPLFISKNRISRFTMVVFPAPVGPTMATFCPGSTWAEKSLMMILSGLLG